MTNCPNCPNQLPEDPDAGIILCEKCNKLVMPPPKPAPAQQ